MRKNDRAPQILVAILVLLYAAFGLYKMQGRQELEGPRAGFADASPLGGRGLVLMLRDCGFTVRRVHSRVSAVPSDAAVWMLLDPETHFSTAEADDLLRWVHQGGTLVWATSLYRTRVPGAETGLHPAVSQRALQQALGINQGFGTPLFRPQEGPLPSWHEVKWESVSDYRDGVTAASCSGDVLEISKPHLLIAGTAAGAQLAEVTYGAGRAVVAPDALTFTNYGLAHDDNATLVANLVRLHAMGGASVVYIDERQHGDFVAPAIVPNLLYYLWQPPLRWAMLQLLGAGLMAWMFYGRRLGAPVPFRAQDPVTRASQYAVAMGSLFRKANRPHAASAIIGHEFRRTLVRRLGLPGSDSDAVVATRAALHSGLETAEIERLLFKAANPASDEAAALEDAREMEAVLRRVST